MTDRASGGVPPPPSGVRLRRAFVSDRLLLESWNRQPHVIAATGDDGPFEWSVELPRTVDWRELLIAEVAGRPIGVLQIIDPATEETHYWGDIGPGFRAIDIWIGEPDALGRGFGSQMMRLAIDRCFADPSVQAILIDPLAANVRARRFYERLGYVAVGPRRFGTDDCIVHRLDRAAWHCRP